MKIERTDKEIIFRIAPYVKIEDIQRFCSYMDYKETDESKATQKYAEALLKEERKKVKEEIKKGRRAKKK